MHSLESEESGVIDTEVGEYAGNDKLNCGDAEDFSDEVDTELFGNATVGSEGFVAGVEFFLLCSKHRISF